MNPFLNPIFLLKIARNYLSDIDRIWHLNQEQLTTYQNKQFRQIVKYAYTVPLYHKKYKTAGIHPTDIKSIKDIEKLPFITKDDLRKHYPDKIIPKGFDTNHALHVSTSGSTGEPVRIYLDKFSAIRSLIGFARVLKAFGGNWRSSKIVLIIDTNPGSIENAFFESSAVPFLRKFISLNNIKYYHLDVRPEEIMKELNHFSPDFLGSDPNMLRQLSFLKNKGSGKDVDPLKIFSSGAVLDPYTRKYVENAFQVQVADMYGTTEGGPLAFECCQGKYHVHSDFVYLEALDKDQKPVSNDTPGNLIVTKLYGGGTPIIRYTGITDVITKTDQPCTCGVTTQTLKKIEGRITDLLVLPDGSTLSPLTITGIPAKTMEKFNSFKIKQFQIIQHDINNIEVKVTIDETQRTIGIPVNQLLQELQYQFIKKIGQNVKINVRETPGIQKDVRTDYVKVVTSYVKKS